jgi:hypothetical protein
MLARNHFQESGARRKAVLLCSLLLLKQWLKAKFLDFYTNIQTPIAL